MRLWPARHRYTLFSSDSTGEWVAQMDEAYDPATDPRSKQQYWADLSRECADEAQRYAAKAQRFALAGLVASGIAILLASIPILYRVLT